MMKLLCLALLCLAASHPVAASPLADAIAPTLAADQPEALKRLKALPPEGLSATDAARRLCVLGRFSTPDAAEALEPSLPAPVARLLRIYRRYWRSVLMHEKAEAEAGKALFAALRAELAVPDADEGTLETAFRSRIESAGLHMLGGRTPPLYELMIWRSQEDRDEEVALPEGKAAVPLSLLDNFASLGWASWASCDATGTGGWASEGRIMVVRPAWKLDSEAYSVSLLGHEAQHVLDKKRFPQREAADLEFRAKLVELILASDSQSQLLAKFARDARSDPSLPHPFADAQVLTRLRRRLGIEDLSRATVEQIRSAASAELRAHTARLRSDSRSVPANR